MSARILSFLFLLIFTGPLIGQFGSTTPGEIEYHPNPPALDSLGILAVVDPLTGQYGHFIFKDQDNQIIEQFEFDNNQLTFQIEGQGAIVQSLSSLSDRLELQGTDLCIKGTTNCISTLGWLADNDQQAVDSIILDSTGIFTFYLENADPYSVNIDQQEIDPVFAAHIVSTITSQDITSWRDHVAQDQDLNSTNELQSLSITQPSATRLVLHSPSMGLDSVFIEVHVDGSYIFGQTSGSGVLQFMTFDTSTNLLSITDANAVDLSSLKQNDDEEICETDIVNSNSLISPVLLHSDPEKRTIQLNGWTASEVASPSHVQHISITNQTINFYETLSNYSVRVCSKQ